VRGPTVARRSSFDIAGFAPDEGETLNELQSRSPAPAMVSVIVPHQLPGGGREFTVAADGFHGFFCADVPAQDAGFYAIAVRTSLHPSTRSRPGGKSNLRIDCRSIDQIWPC